MTTNASDSIRHPYDFNLQNPFFSKSNHLPGGIGISRLRIPAALDCAIKLTRRRASFHLCSPSSPRLALNELRTRRKDSLRAYSREEVLSEQLTQPIHPAILGRQSPSQRPSRHVHGNWHAVMSTVIGPSCPRSWGILDGFSVSS